MLLMGMFEMGYNYYMQSQLQGAVQKAARDSTIEGGRRQYRRHRRQGQRRRSDDIVPNATMALHARAPIRASATSHRAEDFTDINDDGACNDGEPFEDANGNGLWDEDRGSAGGGGARDAVLYVVTVSYPRAFGAAKLIGLSETVTTEATTVLRNQPWDAQEVHSQVGNCA